MSDNLKELLMFILMLYIGWAIAKYLGIVVVLLYYLNKHKT